MEIINSTDGKGRPSPRLLTDYFDVLEISTLDPSENQYIVIVKLAEDIEYLTPSCPIQHSKVMELRKTITTTLNEMKSKKLTSEELLKLGSKCEKCKMDVDTILLDLKTKKTLIRKTKSSLENAKRTLRYHESVEQYSKVAEWLVAIQAANQLLSFPSIESETVINLELDTVEHVQTAPIDRTNDEQREDEIDSIFPAAKSANEARKRKCSNMSQSRKSPRKNAAFTSKLSFCNVLKGGIKRGWPGCFEDFHWSQGIIHCDLCNKTVSHTKHYLKQHIVGKQHQGFRMSKEGNKKRMENIAVALSKEPELVVSDEERTFRVTALFEIAKANIAVKQLQEISHWIQQHAKPGLTLGHGSDLVRTYAQPALEILLKQICDIQLSAFPEYSISMDGTPSFAEAECIILRFVTKDLNIVELVVRVALFEKKLTQTNLRIIF